MLYQEYLTYLPRQKDGKVLDIGCGDGSFIIFLKEQGFKNVHGIDIDHQQVEKCRSRGLRETEYINELGDFLRDKSATYQLIIMKQVIYYFSDEQLDTYLSLVRDSLAADGLLMVEVFNGAILTARFIKDRDHKIKRVFNEYSLRAALENSGLEVLKLLGNDICLDNFKRLIWFSWRQLWTICLRIVYILERGFDPYNPKILSKNIIAIAKRRHC